MTPDSYLSVLEAPLDPYVVPDVGDLASNDVLRPFRQIDPPKLTQAQARAVKKSPVPIVPYVRPLGLGSFGNDVIGAKRAIWRANGLPIPTRATKVFGPLAVKELKIFQKAHGLTPDGVLGPATLRKLGPNFDEYAFLLYAGYPPTATPDQRVRTLIVAYAIWGYNNRVQIHYAEFRPMTYMEDLEHLPVTEDCSTFGTKSYKKGGAKDPNGMNPPYNGYGNTVTMRQHGRIVPASAALPGDLAHYDDPQHVAVYVGNGRVISHGSETDPSLRDLNYRPLREIRTYLGVAAAT